MCPWTAGHVRYEMIVETNIGVKHSEVDKMSIVHNSVYPMWFEAGRRSYLKEAGMPDSLMRGRGLFLPLSEMECRYKSPARLRDKLVVKTDLTVVSCAKIKFEYRIFNRKNGKLVAIGRTVHAWTDSCIKPLNIEKTAPEIYRQLKLFAESTEATAEGT